MSQIFIQLLHKLMCSQLTFCKKFNKHECYIDTITLKHVGRNGNASALSYRHDAIVTGHLTVCSDKSNRHRADVAVKARCLTTNIGRTIKLYCYTARTLLCHKAFKHKRSHAMRGYEMAVFINKAQAVCISVENKTCY